MSNRRTSTRLLTRTLIIALLLAAVLVAVAPAAFANGGPSCWGASCRGKAPQANGCSHDAITLATTPHPGTAGAGYNQFTELRYSPACHAYWSRVTSRLAHGDIKFTRASIQGHVPATRVTNWGSSQAISKMWTRPATACGVSVSKSDPGYMPVGCAP
jgi:hypothetical protein